MVLHVPHMRCYSHPRCLVVGAYYLLSSSNSRTTFWTMCCKVFPCTSKTASVMALFALGRPGGLGPMSHPTWIVRACSQRGPRPAQSHRWRPTEFSKAGLEFSNEICSASRPLSVMLLSLFNLRGPFLRSDGE